MWTAAVVIAALCKHQSVVRLKVNLSLGTAFLQLWLEEGLPTPRVLKLVSWSSEGTGAQKRAPGTTEGLQEATEGRDAYGAQPGLR